LVKNESRVGGARKSEGAGYLLEWVDVAPALPSVMDDYDGDVELTCERL
jgi:hypothetical protein